MALRTFVQKFTTVYRQGGGVVIFNADGHVLVGCRSTFKGSGVGSWQFPQGGYEKKDGSRKDGIIREIREEIGLDAMKDLEFVHQLADPLRYEITEKLTLYKGQEIVWFLFYFPEGDLTKCKLDNYPPAEFSEVTWMNWDDLLTKIPNSKKGMIAALRKGCEPRIKEFLSSKSGREKNEKSEEEEPVKGEKSEHPS